MEDSQILSETNLDGLSRLARSFRARRPRSPLVDADDLVQEAAAALLKAGRKADRMTRAFVADVACAAMRSAWLRALRERAGEAAAMRAASWSTRAPIGRVEALDVRLAAAELPAAEAAAVAAVYFESREIREVAAAAGRYRGTIADRLARARVRLRAALGEVYADEFGRGVARRGLADRRLRVRRAKARRRSYDAAAEAAARLRRKARLLEMAGDRIDGLAGAWSKAPFGRPHL